MGARIIDGKAVAARVRAGVAREVEAFTREVGRAPGLATVLVGDDPASAVYVGGKQRACTEVGMVPFDRRLPANASFEEVAEELERLNADRTVNGVLLQLPVPAHLDGPALTALISPDKDVDGLTPVNAGLLSLGRPGLRPCTPLGVMELLAEAGVELEGAEAVVVGRSNLFGKPMAQLLLAHDATVTTCHSRTRDLREVCSRAEVLIVAVGRARLVTRDFVRPGAVVIDVGMNRLTPEQAGNKSGLVGDVDYAQAVEVASAITPVPGGVGPMTIALLLRNTLQAARYQAELEAMLAQVASSPQGYPSSLHGESERPL
ncbi:MAG TPA: bifunctional methylenetetrahydrofolate dehydrogenase/methenyltetrahydrofolate cyclohydrolase FolD [Solirubrobacteraceae bacterium]|nr:bifunctional methylenetetrahydrofolate dehydrogenase/methenyltetrahydrofolate cyclohydrolase FolD [Solirubrobacteraceae bacterium]